VLISCWAAKGGSGTTVVAAAIALRLARSVPVVLADLAGDLPLVLGLELDQEKPGLADWLAAGPGVSDDALDRLAVPIGPRLAIMPRGAPLPNGTGASLAGALAGRGTVVADCGVVTPGSPSWTVAAEGEQSLLVMRTCYIALRRAMALPLRPSAVVLVEEVGRMVDRAAVEEALGVPVLARVDWDDSIGRAVDAGLLSCRFPAKLRRVARAAA
jgi:hypothetical protein